MTSRFDKSFRKVKMRLLVGMRWWEHFYYCVLFIPVTIHDTVPF